MALMVVIIYAKTIKDVYDALAASDNTRKC